MACFHSSVLNNVNWWNDDGDDDKFSLKKKCSLTGHPGDLSSSSPLFQAVYTLKISMAVWSAGFIITYIIYIQCLKELCSWRNKRQIYAGKNSRHFFLENCWCHGLSSCIQNWIADLSFRLILYTARNSQNSPSDHTEDFSVSCWQP